MKKYNGAGGPATPVYEVCVMCKHAKVLHPQNGSDVEVTCRHSNAWSRRCPCRTYMPPLGRGVPMEVRYRESVDYPPNNPYADFEGPSS